MADAVERSGLVSGDPETWLAVVWDALGGYRETCIPEGDEGYDAEWDDICTAMAWVREGLGLPGEVEAEPEPEPEHIKTADAGRVIDVTPTWSGLLPAMLAVLENGTAEGREVVLREMARMARAADVAVALERGVK